MVGVDVSLSLSLSSVYPVQVFLRHCSVVVIARISFLNLILDRHAYDYFRSRVLCTNEMNCVQAHRVNKVNGVCHLCNSSSPDYCSISLSPSSSLTAAIATATAAAAAVRK